LADLLPVDQSNKNKRKKWDDVEILDCSYLFSPITSVTEESVNLQSKIMEDFGLNEEQARAFRIVANHVEHPHLAPLRMYLVGMGGTGKSQVIHAIISFFEQRKKLIGF
jgi:hypothetical protein